MIRSKGRRETEYLARMGMRYAYKSLTTETEKRDHSEDLQVDGVNIRMDLREIGCEGVKWVYVTQDRNWRRAVARWVLNLRVP